MSKREVAVSLRHMLDYCREAITFCEGKTRDDLETDRTLNLIVVRLLEGYGRSRYARADRISSRSCRDSLAQHH